MNILKAADDIKNFSDQQLLSAGENPVMLPPYLVLAEMKRREQMRAEFAKSQQQQQPPTVIQQTAQNLAQSQQQQGQPQQGQPQQGMPQQPQAQGIMQGAPQQVMAMASGGYVPRYAAGTQPDLKYFMDQLNRASPPATPQPPEQASPSLAMSREDIAKLYPDKPLDRYINEMRSAYGPRDYSAQKKLVDDQTKIAESKKPSLGNALIAAGGFMAANRDNKVGLANLLAQAIGVGSQSYDAAKDNQNKLRNLAMMGQVALQSQQQKDSDDMIGKAMESKRSDVGVNLNILQTLEANRRSLSEALSRAKSDSEQRRLQREMALNQNATSMFVSAAANASHERQAYLTSAMRNQPKPSQNQIENERAQELAANALMYTGNYLRQNPKDKSDRNKLAMDNLFKSKNVGGKEVPAFYEGFNMEDRMRAYGLIQNLIVKETSVEKQQASMEAARNKANPLGGLGTQITSGQQEESFTGDFNGRRIN